MNDQSQCPQAGKPAPTLAGGGAVRGMRGWKLVLGGVALLGMGLVAGLLLFVRQIETRAARMPGRADGIVVLTGGPDRIADGLQLLAEGRASRMLITGVRRGVSLETIGRPMPRYAAVMSCCVDLEYEAQNTVGNAVATRRWAREKGYRSLIVVTSDFHLPRALIEFRRAMPDIVLFRQPVVSERVEVGSWWRDPPVAKIIVLEYVKFLAAWCRMQVSGLLPG